MPYQTGTASTSTDLIQKLITFLVANGWTSDLSATEGSGWRVHAHLGGNYVHLRACENENTPWLIGTGVPHYGVHMYLGTGFNGSNAWNNQTTGAPIGTSSNPMGVGIRLSAGPFSNYYFFCDSSGDNVTVVVEKTPGLYVYLGFGSSMNKQGSWTGGPYFFGSTSGFYTAINMGSAQPPGFTVTSDCPGGNRDAEGVCCAFVRADVDTFTGKWIGIENFASGSVTDEGSTGREGDSSVCVTSASMKTVFPVYSYGVGATYFQNCQTSEQDGRANLLPILWWVQRDSTSTGYSLLGSIPNVFFTNAVGNGFSNADEYSLGSDTYKIFPNFAVLKQP